MAVYTVDGETDQAVWPINVSLFSLYQKVLSLTLALTRYDESDLATSRQRAFRITF